MNPPRSAKRERTPRRAVLQSLGGGVGGAIILSQTGGATRIAQQSDAGDTRSEARLIEPGQTIHDSIGPCCLPVVADENDWFAFDVNSGDEIRVEFHERPPAILRLIGPNGAVLDNEDHTGPSRLTGSTSQSGTAYLHVTDPPGSANSTYSFTVSLSSSSDTGGDTGGDDDDTDGTDTPSGAHHFSFETASPGSPPADPWYIQNTPDTNSGVEISTEFASHGEQSLHMWSYRNDLAITRVGLDLDLTEISSMTYDAYNEASNANWGDVKINLDGIPGHSNDTTGETLDHTLVDGFPPEDQWYTNIEVDLSPYTGDHTIVLWVRGNRNDVYWDNIRFQN